MDIAVKKKNRHDENGDADQHQLHGRVLFGMVYCSRAPGRHLVKAAADPRHQRSPHRDQGPDATGEHGADAHVSDLRCPDLKSHVSGPCAVGYHLAQHRVRFQVKGAVNGDGYKPGDGAADANQRGDIQSYDVTDAEKGWRHIGADVGDALARKGGRLGCLAPEPKS